MTEVSLGLYGLMAQATAVEIETAQMIEDALNEEGL